MRYVNSIFVSLLKPIDRRAVRAIVARHDGDAYDKSFRTWDHLVALIYAQLGQVNSLRALEAAFNANSHHHYHLGVGELSRSTVSDANARRPPAVFMDIFAMLMRQADRLAQREGAEMLRLIDSSPIPLGKLFACATWNGRIKGMKMHVVYDPGADCPRAVVVTAANVNDIEIGRETALEPGATYVFDKGYCHYGWWRDIHATAAVFVTRAKANAQWKIVRKRPLADATGNGFTVLEDRDVALASKGDSKLPIPMRRIRIKRDNGGIITLITNDLKRSAAAIGALYRTRWQIELLFRWIKQHLKLRKFLGNSENAVRLQIVAAMIAYLLLRIAARLSRKPLPPLRFAEMIAQSLFTRKSLAAVDQPPPVNPSRRKVDPHQLVLSYA